MNGLIPAVAAAAGTYLVYEAVTSQYAPDPARVAEDLRRGPRVRAQEWMVQAGLGGVRVSEFGAVVGVLAAAGALAGYALFGGPLAAIAIATFAGTFPVAAHRHRRQARRDESAEAWPRMIEEIRALTGGAGRSIPQALFEVGRRAPADLQPSFEAAQRHWLLTTDFEATLRVLKAELADPTADATCETLLIAHQIGGTDLDRRLESLAEDRRQEVQGRKDARAKQAGVRFARRFVLIVPLGMAVAGMSIGTGRSAYQTATGQLLVLAGIAAVGACWIWAGRLMQLPTQDRVFPE